MAEYFKSHARRVMQMLGEDPKETSLRRIIGWLHRRGKPGVRPRDVVRAGITGIKKADDAKNLLDELATRGEGEWRLGPPKSSGQKGRELFFLI